MQYWAYYISIFIMGLTLLIHLQLIAAPAILVPIGFLLAIVSIAIGVSAAMKTDVDLDFMFHKTPDKKTNSISAPVRFDRSCICAGQSFLENGFAA